MKILITGAGGQLGREIERCVSSPEFNNKNDSYIFATKEKLDITNSIELEKHIFENEIQVVLNTAAYTAVDKAESEPEKASLINCDALKGLTQICKKRKVFLLHISTDYVFNGEKGKPCLEEDALEPLGIYAVSKKKGEDIILQSGISSMILRTSWLYSEFGSNFLKTILRLRNENKELRVVNDQWGSPTWARELAENVLKVLPQMTQEILSPEIFHWSGEGETTWFEFAKEILCFKYNQKKIISIPSSEYPTASPRPHYSYLSKDKWRSRFHGMGPRPWKESLQNFFKIYEK